MDRAAKVHALEAEKRRLALGARSPLAGIIGASPQMLEVSRLVEKIAPGTATVLILGKSGPTLYDLMKKYGIG